MSALTIQDEGVRIWLHSANEETEHAETLERIYSRRRNKDSAEANALWAGHFALFTKARDSVEHLRKRGGLLHYMHAQVVRVNGEYIVRGAA